ncbi:hypothetical protein, partial [Atlantibacter hermannii]|uniref:hypothetical protein n=1 Tax=Atlantibacter hermannii TaxID=565 RepID=UPI0028A5BCBF
ILISESAWEEMTCLFAPSIAHNENKDFLPVIHHVAGKSASLHPGIREEAFGRTACPKDKTLFIIMVFHVVTL